MSSRGTLQQPPARILIVRLSAIGDVVHTMPLACALRERFPAAFLAWAAEQRAAALLRGHPALDELITLPRGWLKSPSTVWRVRRRLHALRFDTAIDAQGLTKAAILAWLSGARRRIGFGNAWGRELSRWLNTELVDTTAEHAVDRTLQLLLPLGIQAPAARFQVPEHPADRAAAEQIIRQAGLEDGFAIINPGAGWPSKLWPTDRYAAVAIHLGRTWRLPTLVAWGGQKERDLAEQTAAGSQGHAVVAPPTTLTELAALTRRCRLFIGSDTGPLHVAAAVGTPCVGLYGPWPAKGHGPYGPQHIALQELLLEASTRARRNAPISFMEAIHVESVCGACDQILKRDGRYAA
jgi:heptosyltransferase-1